MRVVDLRVKHLARLAPRANQRLGRLCHLGVDAFAAMVSSTGSHD
ncbi:hypothetical protein ABIF72_009695 [Bradyrhizobium japonicum]